MSKEQDYKFHCNNKGLHFSDPGFKPICETQCQECKEYAGVVEPEQNEKLTEEEFLHTVRGIRPEVSMSGCKYLFKDVVKLLGQFAAQQVEHATADLKKESERMMEVILSIYESGVVDRSDINSINEIIAYENRKGGTGAACYPIICSETEYEKLQKKNDELQEEVAGLSLALDHEKSFASIEKTEFNIMRAEIDHLKTQLSEAQRQRDEAVALVKEYKFARTKYTLLQCDEKADIILSRLSSGETKPVNTFPEVYPGSWGYPLFKHMSDEHRKILTDSELHDIVEIVRKMDGEKEPENEMPSRHEQDCYTRGICPECGQNFPDEDIQPYLTDKK